MTAKEYLSQARHFDLKINSKLEHLNSLSDLANKCTSHISGMPGSPLSSKSLMADAINKVIDLQNEIAEDIKNLWKSRMKFLRLFKGWTMLSYKLFLKKDICAVTVGKTSLLKCDTVCSIPSVCTPKL